MLKLEHTDSRAPRKKSNELKKIKGFKNVSQQNLNLDILSVYHHYGTLPGFIHPFQKSDSFSCDLSPKIEQGLFCERVVWGQTQVKQRTTHSQESKLVLATKPRVAFLKKEKEKKKKLVFIK